MANPLCSEHLEASEGMSGNHVRFHELLNQLKPKVLLMSLVNFSLPHPSESRSPATGLLRPRKANLAAAGGQF